MSELRYYQVEAIEAATQALEEKGRATIVMACGSGKTWVGLESAKRLVPQDGNLLILVPGLTLIQQWYSHLIDIIGNVDILGLCSDDELSDKDGNFNSPTTTDPEVLREFLTKREGEKMKVIMCTYHSSPTLSGILDGMNFKFDLAIADEAHRTAGVRGSAFSTILHDNLIASTRRLFLTATPRMRLSTRTSDGKEIASMSDKIYYGEQVYKYTFGQAIQDKTLSDYQVVVMVVSDHSLHKDIMHNTGMMVDGEAYNARSLAACVSLHKVREQFGVSSALVFHNTISSSRAFTTNMKSLSVMEEMDHPKIYHLDGVTSQMARQTALESLANPLENSWSVISNVRVLTEGVDVPSIDSVMFAEPKTSQVDVVQAIGRALRLSERQTRSVIVIPVYLAPGENPHAMLSGSNYRHVWQVINAIRDHDKTLDEEIERIHRNDYDPLRDKYEPEIMPERILISGAPRDIEEYRSAISTMILDNITTNFATGLEVFIRYMGSHSNPEVPTRYVDEHTQFPLGRWVQQYRQSYRWNRLEPEKISALEAAGFTWGKRSQQWRKMTARAGRYADVLGVTHLTAQEVMSYDRELWEWLSEQRERKSKGVLSPDEQKELTTYFRGWNAQGGIGVENLEPKIKLLESWRNKVLKKSKKKNRKLSLFDMVDPSKGAYESSLWSVAFALRKIVPYLDEDTKRMMTSIGIEFTDENIQIDQSKDGWEIEFLRNSISGTHILEDELDARAQTPGRKAVKRPQSLQKGFREINDLVKVFPRGDWIATTGITDRDLPGLEGKTILRDASYAVMDAENRYNPLVDYFVEEGSLNVWKSDPDIPGIVTQSGKMGHHLDEIYTSMEMDVDLSPEAVMDDINSKLKKLPELRNLEDKDIIPFYAAFLKSTISILNQVVKKTMEDIYPGVKVRVFNTLEEEEKYLERSTKRKLLFSRMNNRLEVDMFKAIDSRSPQIQLRIAKLVFDQK